MIVTSIQTPTNRNKGAVLQNDPYRKICPRTTTLLQMSSMELHSYHCGKQGTKDSPAQRMPVKDQHGKSHSRLDGIRTPKEYQPSGIDHKINPSIMVGPTTDTYTVTSIPSTNSLSHSLKQTRELLHRTNQSQQRSLLSSLTRVA